jgi:ABC-2 type transport system permease protein
MTSNLVRKLLRDVRLTLIVVGLLLAAFQCLWTKITERILGQLAPFLYTLAEARGLMPEDIETEVFKGPGQILRTLMGGEKITLDRANDMMTIGWVHPLIITIFCVWAIGRAAGAIAGELDRGTMELLLAQPLARSRVVLAHLWVDLITIPILSLSMWGGTILGVWIVGPIKVQTSEVLDKSPAKPAYLLELGPFKVRLANPAADLGKMKGSNNAEEIRRRLEVNPWAFGAAAWVVGGLMFAVSGFTMWLSALGRYRGRVLGLAVFLVLLQFLINLIGQMWDVMEPLRPLTVFYYYQPQQVVLLGDWYVTLREWNGGKPLCHVPMVGVLIGIGVVGYGLTWWTFTRRDLPAPL